MKKIISLWILFFGIIGCSSDPRVDSKNVPMLESSIYFIPSSYYGTSYKQFANLRSREILQGESGRFIAEIRVDGSGVSSESASDFIKNFIWNIGKESYVASAFSRAFPDTGIFDITLKTIDYFEDTLTDTITFYVTTPLTISPIFPQNGYNRLNALDSLGIDFTIKTEGINSWQDVECLLYISMDKSVIWSSPYDTIPCNGTYHLDGPIFIGEPSDFADTSYALYWGVISQEPKSDYNFDYDTSNVQVFYTAFIGTDSAHLIIPIWYKSLSPGNNPNGNLLLQNENGDTIALAHFKKNPAVIEFKRLAADSNLQLTIWDSTLTEFTSTAITLNLPKSSYNLLDTIWMKDSIPPMRVPQAVRFAKKDSIRFSLFDAGSGVSHNSVTVVVNDDTLARTIRNDEVRFLPNCIGSCNLTVSLRDYAGNVASSVMWQIANYGDSLEVLGPYNPEDL